MATSRNRAVAKMPETAGTVMTSTVGGLVPTPPNDSAKFLNGVGTFTIPSNEAFNVKAFGAVGNGVTDDTTAIVAAITACAAAGGGTVFFPSGIYVCLSTLNITSNYIELVGTGKYGSRIAFYNTTGNGIKFSGTSLPLCGIRNLGLVAASVFTGTLLETNNVFFFTCDNVHIEGAGYAAGLALMYGSGVYISNTSMTNALSYGLKCSAGNDYFITNTTVNMIGVTGNCLYLSAIVGGAATIVNSTFLGGANCLIENSNYITLSTTYFDSAQGAVQVTGCTHVYANETEVANRVSSGSGDGGGWKFSTSKNFVLSNSMVINCGTTGVTVMGTCSDFVISNNQIDANNTTNAANKYGLLIGNGATNFAILGNRVGNITAGFGGHQKYGIAINAGASDYYIIKDNIVLNNETAGIIDAGTGVHAIVTNNLGYNPVGIAVVAPPASTVTYQAGHGKETIYLTGGTVTAVKLPDNAGSTVFLTTPCTLHLEPGETFSVTYTVAPTMSKQQH